MTTMKDVARAAGVSVTTVSATINETAPVSEALRQRVWEAVERTGYAPDPVARHLRSGRSTTVGLVIPDITTPYAAHLAKALHQALSERGYRLFLSSNDHDPETELKDIESFTAHRVAGLIVMPTSLGGDDARRLTAAIRVPAVLVDRVIAGAPFDTVADDNRLGAELLTRYALRLGHAAIAFFAGRPNVSPSDERIAAFLAALAEAGVPAEALVTKSNGGVMSAELGKIHCAQMIMSGTAAG
ncbi:MAG: LacI family DNA-binding transcriptional regulator, partial [Xanthomonadales bacterium]|nr:LacI family DNA-binding transcriptional regulator [Xanthomonadales bacterium]